MNEAPRRVQLSRAKGHRMPPNTRSVARPTPWGNPYCIGEEGVPDAATAVRLFAKLLKHEDLDKTRYFMFTRERLRMDLGGMNLACWCALPKAGEPDLCHAVVLLEAANS